MLPVNSVQINQNFWNGEEENRLRTLKLLLAGYSNNCIAKELNFSLKNIESIIAKLFRRCGIITRGASSHLINPRVKLMVNGLTKEWLRYNFVDEVTKPQELLSRNQYLTLVLCAAGCSNKAIADFLCISSKTVESRLNALFNQFGVNAQADKQVNPRIRLNYNALAQKVITPNAIRISAEILNAEEWDDVIKNREQIKETFLRMQFEQTRPYILQPDTALSSVMERLNALKPIYAGIQTPQIFPNLPPNLPTSPQTKPEGRWV
ncbi:MAG: LuxR C-terminal-related transcriptional regulator [Candidatus Caenarcaniphilales bacterium]|nr:LuxR C-terminal-related transcriptional regulator [Candidatus Caenarcaniphilales bacterium]